MDGGREAEDGGEEEEALLLEEEDSNSHFDEDGTYFLRQRKGHFSNARARFNLSAASQIIKRKIHQSELLMLPRRLWMQTVPTQDCEVVVLFSCSCDESAVNWLTNRLRTRVPELVIASKEHLAPSKARALYVTATMDGLVKGGQELGLSKKTRLEYGSGFREINQVELNMFQGIEDPKTFFTSQERQSIVLHLLHSLRGAEDDQVANITFRPGQGIVATFVGEGLIQEVAPLHDQQLLVRLRRTWVQTFFRYQPLDFIHEYFGAKIGIYFAWLGFYTASLTVPAAIGFVFWINFWGKDQAKEDKAFVVLAFLNVVWGSVWLEAWKRRSAELTSRWGIDDPHHELLKDPRPQFTGDLEVSPITGRIEPVYPPWKRNLFRYLLTVPVVSLCLTVVIFVMFIILQFQDWLDSVIKYRGLPWSISYGPKFALAIMISIFDEIYNKIAIWLNDIENYRDEDQYQNHLITKLAIFRLVNSFLGLFYIAFYLQDVEVLKAQLAALFLTRQIAGNIRESCIPYISEQFKMAKLSFDLFGTLSPTNESAREETNSAGEEAKSGKQNERQSHEEDEGRRRSEKNSQSTPTKSRIVSQAEVECNMAKYDDTFEDYLEMFIQFGYVMFFSSAFPLGAVCAFVNNLIEIRSDAFKLCCVFQRPFGQRVRSIGVWQDAMEFMCLLGIMVNCMLIGLSGQVHRMFPEMSTSQTILLIIVLEHAMIALKYGISYAIPDVPKSIAQEIAKGEFRRREALKHLSLSYSPPIIDGYENSSSRQFPGSSLPSTEYMEKSVQTDPYASRSRKSSKDSATRKGSTDSRAKETDAKRKDSVDSISGLDRSKPLPKAVRQLNESAFDFSTYGSKDAAHSTYSPVALSAPANFDKKKRLFSFLSENEKPQVPAGQATFLGMGDEKSRSSESVIESTIKEESVASDAGTDAETLPDESSLVEDRKERKNSQSKVSYRKFFARSESIAVPTPRPEPEVQVPPSGSPVTAATSAGTPKIGKIHPVKLLKRAQSFSQAISVFKKNQEIKKKKVIDRVKDDYSLALGMEPLGELALVPLEKLVSIEDLRIKLSLKENNISSN